MNPIRSGLFLPCYNTGTRTAELLHKLVPYLPLFEKVLVIDNASSDNTVELTSNAIKNLGLSQTELIRNPTNLGYGGSQKIALAHFLALGLDYAFLIPGDGQGDLNALKVMVETARRFQSDLIVGSRFAPGGGTYPGYSKVRRFGNRLIYLFQTWASGLKITDSGTGQMGYRLDFIRRIPYLSFTHSYHFTPQVILEGQKEKAVVHEVPVIWGAPSHSNVKVSQHVWDMLRLFVRFKVLRNTF